MSATKSKTWQLDMVGEIGRMVSVKSWEHSYSEHGNLPTFEENERASEQALRKLHDALNEHFAPVLRWVDTPRGCVAEIGSWRLSVEKRDIKGKDWWGELKCAGVTVFSCAPAAKDTAQRTLVDALRITGVVFRTEGES